MSYKTNTIGLKFKQLAVNVPFVLVGDKELNVHFVIKNDKVVNRYENTIPRVQNAVNVSTGETIHLGEDDRVVRQADIDAIINSFNNGDIVWLDNGSDILPISHGPLIESVDLSLGDWSIVRPPLRFKHIKNGDLFTLPTDHELRGDVDPYRTTLCRVENLVEANSLVINTGELRLVDEDTVVDYSIINTLEDQF